eukprot:CAMPEP_0116058636 /NCGR_PEP_ID=MMETSP0322-20121206/5313_1 /TAXON_ID=163516 /ORGANISM="Leptocylindrus danicus var. apora, Strain B651" /LENGTH=302 /DNA_ID=CAMNT_0003542853 /DNA_START=125 /DNA_END=1033 /DNA_ORIENTATION=-
MRKVYIRSRRPHHPALRRYELPRYRPIVLADQFENATERECWTLEHLGNDTYHIYCGGWYLHADPDGNVCCEKTSYGDPWKIEYTRKGYVSIKSCFNKYLCADEGFRVTANREHCELWEQWAIVDEPHLLISSTREVYIRSYRQQSFRYDDALPLLSYLFKATNHGKATLDEKWHMMCIDVNKVALFTHVDKYYAPKYLSVDADGTLLKNQRMCPNEGDIWTIEKVEGAPKSYFALKSAYGRYLRCDLGDHFMCNGSVKADSEDCGDERTWWVFTTDPGDVCGVRGMKMDEIMMTNRNRKFS